MLVWHELNRAVTKSFAGFIDPVVILKAGVYNVEIKKDILENINSNVTFFE